MDVARTRTLFVLVTVLWLLAGLIAINGPHLLSIAPNPPELKVSVSPNAIPISGAWVVTTCLHYLENNTCVAVHTTVKMIAFLSDRTRFVQTKNTTGDQVAFQVLSGIVGVRFEASYYDSSTIYAGIYTGAVNLSGPTVVPEGEGWGLLLFAITAGSAYLTAALEDLLKIRALRNKRRFLVLSGFLAAVILPCAYVMTEMPVWFGTGWLPVSFYGIPLWALPVSSTVISGVAAAPYLRKDFDRARGKWRLMITKKGSEKEK
jgi:hypothetical protein